ncbi:MAG TPA: J domain-containing protein [Alphaproteobacteria bacterium]
MRYFYDPPQEEPEHYCDHPGCAAPGLYKAPKSRDNLRDYYHFCLDHVRDYNRGWNFFADFDEEKIYEQMRQDVSWERPSWPSHISPALENRLRRAANFWGAQMKAEQQAPPPPNIKTPIRDAFSALGLAFDVDFTSVKQQFRKLVKKYHPDARPDDPKATERFKTINAAYVTLKNYFAGEARK